MNNRVEIENEIFEMLDNGIIGAHELLMDLIGAMSTQELSENWDYIKRCRDLNVDLECEQGE